MEGIIANCRNTDGSRATTGMLIHQALRAKKIFVFGELLALAPVQKMKQTADYELLEIFAYGTFNMYQERQAYFESHLGQPLNAVQVTKLQQLTVLTLASQKKHLPYGEVQQATGLRDVRAVEDLVITCVYDGLLKATCNQKMQCFVVHWCAARDVRMDQELHQVIAKLDAWLQSSAEVCANIDSAVQIYLKEKQDEKEFHDMVRSEADRCKLEVLSEGDSSMQNDPKNKGGGGGGGPSSLLSFMTGKRQ